MKRILTTCFAAIAVLATWAATNSVSLKDITSGAFAPEYLRTITPLNDGETYAQISQDGNQIVAFAYKTGKQTAVLFDVNNTVGERIERFEDYIMSPDGKKMLIQTNSNRIYRRSFTADYYIYTIATRRLERLSDNGPQQAPVWSQDGWQVAFVRDNNIYLVKLLYDNAESQVTKDGRKNEVINGIPDWVYEEEFGFNSALAFNADGTMLCWVRFDETKVPEFSLETYKGLKPEQTQYAVYPGAYAYKYPKAGQQNSTVSVYSYDIKSHQTRQLDVPVPADGYIPRLKATASADRMIVYTMNRHQDELCLYGVNPRSTVSQLIVKESVPKYVGEDVIHNIRITPNNIILPSDRDGMMQLYLYSITGTLQRKLTNARNGVTEVYGYDEATGNVYYQAAGQDALNREVYVTLKNGKTQQLTPDRGWNSATFSTNYRYFINQWSDADTPYRYTICNSQGKNICQLVDNKQLINKLSTYNLPKKEFFKFTTSEGVELNGVMMKPADFNPAKKYPVVMWQYSGPGSQQVKNAWTIGSMGNGGLYDAYLTQRGFIVVCVDGRGTGARGADFEKCTYKNIGKLEARDQVETALWLGKQPYVDADNIGIWGWSYGGFCTLMSMSEGRPVFKAGVAVAPPTSWRYYDSVYTERFMQTPQENPTGYDDNPIARADKLHGALLLCHGLADDNVHPQNTFEYTEALVQADKDFRMNVYTNRNHSIYGGNTRNHLLRQIADFLVEHLQ